MKAIFQTKYGDPFEALEYGEAQKPTPDADQALVKVGAAAINFGNWAMVSGKPFFARAESGWLAPTKILNSGSDVSGIIEAVGANVTQFKPGDEIYADNLPGGHGTFAEFVCVPEKEMALKPDNISFEKAAAVPQAALVALQGLRDVGGIQPGQRVLITGASGGNGTFAVQIAKSYETEVTAVCSTRNIELVRSLGADHVIDYTQHDFVQDGERYDLILAMGGYRKPGDYLEALLPKGTFVWVGGDLKGLFQTMALGSWFARGTDKTLTALSHQANQDDLNFMTEMIEAGKVTPVIDRSFPLEKTAAAFQHYGAGHMQGKVVIKVI